MQALEGGTVAAGEQQQEAASEDALLLGDCGQQLFLQVDYDQYRAVAVENVERTLLRRGHVAQGRCAAHTPTASCISSRWPPKK
jgi:hypothetical protein